MKQIEEGKKYYSKKKRVKFGGRKRQIVFKCNNGAVASPIISGFSQNAPTFMELSPSFQGSVPVPPESAFGQ